MAIDRSKFKKTSASQLAQADKDLNKTLGRKERNQSNGHDIDDGANLFRIYPAHPEEDGGGISFVEAFCQSFIPAMVQEKDKDGKLLTEGGKPKMKLSVKPVWNAKVHGGKPKDLIEEYINLARKQAKKLSENEAKEYLKPIYGAFSKDKSKNIQGINYPLKWVLYADKYPNANPAATPAFDELRIGKGIKERLNKIAAMESASDPLGTDPFTDIEEGKAIKVIKDTETDNPNNYYTTEIDNTTVNEVHAGKTFKVAKTYPLTDAQLDAFLKVEPLAKKYGKKLATRKNFEAQLAGLEILDNKYNMEIFDLPEWGELVLEIDGYYPETDAAEDNTSTANDEPGEDADVQQDEPTGDQYDAMSRSELTAYARKMKTGIVVLPSMKDDAIREALRKWDADTEIPNEPLPGDEVETAPEVVETKPEMKDDFQREMNEPVELVKEEVKSQPATGGLSAKEKLAAMRNKSKAA